MHGDVARPVELLVGIRDISRFLRVSTGRVKALAERGAPLTRDVAGVTRAEKTELWQWYRENYAAP